MKFVKDQHRELEHDLMVLKDFLKLGRMQRKWEDLRA